MKNKILIFKLFLLFDSFFNISYAQEITRKETFGNYVVEFYSNSFLKLKRDNKILLTVPYSKDINDSPEVFMEDVDFDGDLDLFISTSCGSNCSYDVYTSYRGNFSLNTDLTKISFLSDYFFDKEKKHFSIISRTVKLVVH